MITIDDMIILNQMCQRHSNKDTEQEWFLAQSSTRQHNLIEWLAQMINQAGANNLDAKESIENLALKATLTPCVLLTSGKLKQQLKKVFKLKHPELSIAFCLMLQIFRNANTRRIKQHPENLERHWWNWDLNDPSIIAKVRNLYEAGDL